MSIAEILAVLNVHFAHKMYAAEIFHVNTGKGPGFSFIEVHPNCNNCSHEIAVLMYSSGALCFSCDIKTWQIAIEV